MEGGRVGVESGVVEGGLEGREEFFADDLVDVPVDRYPLGAVGDLFARSFHCLPRPS